MRLLFFILLLVNVAVFGYFTYRDQGSANLKPQRPPVNADRIRLVNPADVPAPTGNAAAPKLACMEWSGFKPEAIDQAQQALDKLALGDKLMRPKVDEYWLYIPPQKNKKEAQKKLEELVGLGIEDGQLVEDAGKWRWAISFAAYSSEEAAIVRLNQLKEKGLKTAKLLKREALGNVFLILQADEKLSVELNQLKSAYAGTELKEIECKTP
ncbi:MAG: SPOR domain-containing protein [Burkholderiales bacterium]|nr:SPOR domain-containing protein [Burkholderiales bacterium]